MYLSRDPLIVSGEIWAEQSCHIPDHCKRPANTSQHHQSHHWAALHFTGLHRTDLYLFPFRPAWCVCWPCRVRVAGCCFGKVESFIKCQSVGDSLYWVYFVLRGGGIFTMRSVLFHCRAPASDWHTITLFLIVNLMPPASSEVFGVKLLHIFHPPFSADCRLMEFICWEQHLSMWKYSALVSSCSIDLWFNAPSFSSRWDYISKSWKVCGPVNIYSKHGNPL